MRILVISNSEWDDGNSFGSTFSNILGFEKPENIANIFCRNGTPNTSHCTHFLDMGESAIMNKLFKNADFCEAQSISSETKPILKTSKIKGFIRTQRWVLFFWARELLWSITNWKKSQSLNAFIQNFQPDLILLPTYSYSYINKLALHISHKYNVPIVSYISDDEYSLRQRSFSPLYWINRFYQRFWIKKAFDKSKILYTISDIQRDYFERIVNCPCKVITKGAVFNTSQPQSTPATQPIKLLYAGNIGSGRWKSLGYIATAVSQINTNNLCITLDIYTSTPLTNKIKSTLSGLGVSLHEHVSPKELSGIISSSDVLIHAESFDKQDKCIVWQSFSTKIVDYLSSGKCVLSIGPSDVASIDLLKKNDIALVIDSPEKTLSTLRSILENPNCLNSYIYRAWAIGKELFDLQKIHSIIETDLLYVINNKNK